MPRRWMEVGGCQVHLRGGPDSRVRAVPGLEVKENWKIHKYVENKQPLDQKRSQREILQKYLETNTYKYNTSKFTVYSRSILERDILVINAYIKKEVRFQMVAC